MTAIGNYAFSNNQLTSVIIPNSVIILGACVFNNNKLTDDQAFIYARNVYGSEIKTNIISYGGSKRSNVQIPNNVTSIGIRAFAHNQLTSVTISNSVTSIYGIVFSNNKLTSVKIIGKTASSEFANYGANIWGWTTGYSDSNINWNWVE